MSGPDPHKIEVLEVALQVAEREITGLQTKLAIQKVQIKKCRQQVRGLINVVASLRAQINAILAKSNGASPHR